MANSALEIVGLLLSLIGLIGTAASTGMPMWRVTAFIGENIIVFETRYEGLWMNCFRQANIRMQCKVYDSLLALPPDLQAARGLMCCGLALGGVGLLVSILGLQCTACIRDNDRAKRMVLIIAGSMILGACICVIIPVSWTGHTIIRDFYNPLLIDAQRRELGEALYIGWVTSALLFVAGVILLCRHAPRIGDDEMERMVNGPGYIYQPGVNYQPGVSYQPGSAYAYQPYSYQPNYSAPPGSVVYAPNQYM